jgi:hypothetical protein
VAVRTHPAQNSSNASQSDNRLALIDQAFYMGHRAAGQKEVMQVAWRYEHPVDMEALKRFHRELGSGLLGRLIERPPLPFGRYRWISAGGPTELDSTDQVRPREELGEWFDERAQLPLDPESGPGWRMSIVPLSDGSTAISLVISHYVIDGIGAVLAVAEALLGIKRDLGYPPAGSRSPLRAVIEDVTDTVRDVPEIARAGVVAIKEVRLQSDNPPPAAQPGADDTGNPDDVVVVPNVWMFADYTEWEACAKALGGTSNTLAAGFSALLAKRMGRPLGAGGTVPVQLVVNDRTDGTDARAVAVAFTRVHIDPEQATTDLSTARADIKQALKTLKDEPDQMGPALAPLTPITPTRTWKQIIERAVDDPDQPAVCSILGDVGDVVTKIDGTLCEYAYCRGTSQHLTRRWLDRMGGQLQVLLATSAVVGKIQISIQAYQPGTVTTKRELRELAERTLAEFDLKGEFD